MYNACGHLKCQIQRRHHLPYNLSTLNLRILHEEIMRITMKSEAATLGNTVQQ